MSGRHPSLTATKIARFMLLPDAVGLHGEPLAPYEHLVLAEAAPPPHS